jgi:hypothetical protein
MFGSTVIGPDVPRYVVCAVVTFHLPKFDNG